MISFGATDAVKRIIVHLGTFAGKTKHKGEPNAEVQSNAENVLSRQLIFDIHPLLPI